MSHAQKPKPPRRLTAPERSLLDWLPQNIMFMSDDAWRRLLRLKRRGLVRIVDATLGRHSIRVAEKI